MAQLRWPILVAVVAITIGITWLAGREGDPPAQRPAPASAPPATGSATGPAAAYAPAGPSLATGGGALLTREAFRVATPATADGAPPEPVAASPQPAFAAQARDPAWAGATEAEIQRRLARLGAKLERAECRHDQCELTFGGSTEDVADSLAALENGRGLRALARSVLLTAPEQRDGRTIVRAYARFDRGEPPAPASPDAR